MQFATKVVRKLIVKCPNDQMLFLTNTEKMATSAATMVEVVLVQIRGLPAIGEKGGALMDVVCNKAGHSCVLCHRRVVRWWSCCKLQK